MEITIPANLLATLLLLQLHSKGTLLPQLICCPPGSPHLFVQKFLLASPFSPCAGLCSDFVELLQAPVSPFLQPVCIPLDSNS